MRREEILRLLKIQEIDQEIERLERYLRKVREERERRERELAGVREEETSLERKEAELTGKLRSLRERLSEEEDLLEKTERRMLAVRKDHEYRALLREKAKHEDTILKLFYEIEDLERRISEFREEAERRHPLLRRRARELREEIEELVDEENTAVNRLKSTKEDREKYIEGLDEASLRFYNEAKERFGTTIIAKIEEGVCTGCGMKVPDVLFSKLLRENSIERCPSCGRYIYYRL